MTTPTAWKEYKINSTMVGARTFGPFTATAVAIKAGTLLGINLTTGLVAACSNDAGANAFCGLAMQDYPASATDVYTVDNIILSDLPSEASVNDGDLFRPAYANDGGASIEVNTLGPQIGVFVGPRVGSATNAVLLQVGGALSV